MTSKQVSAEEKLQTLKSNLREAINYWSEQGEKYSDTGIMWRVSIYKEVYDFLMKED